MDFTDSTFSYWNGKSVNCLIIEWKVQSAGKSESLFWSNNFGCIVGSNFHFLKKLTDSHMEN